MNDHDEDREIIGSMRVAALVCVISFLFWTALTIAAGITIGRAF